MISKKHRFHGHHSLDFTYRHGKTARCEFMGLRYVKSRGGHFRMAVVVSKKVSKSAVVRNRIRRRVYEAVRITHQKAPLPARDMILTIYDERIAKIPSDQLHASLHSLLEKAANSDKNRQKHTAKA